MPKTLIATSGTLLSFGRILAAGTGDESRHIGGFTIHASEMEELAKQIQGMDAAQRSKLPRMEPRRVDLLPAAATLVLEVLRTSGVERIVFCDWGVREGILLQDADHPQWVRADPASLRRASIEEFGRRHRLDPMHGRQTARLALEIFDAVRSECPVTDRHRELLEYGALIHDVGNAVAFRGHHRHGAYLLRHSPLVAFEPADRAVMVALVRYHRSTLPREGHPETDALGDGDLKAIDALVGILRLADGLDRSRRSEVTDLEIAAGPKRITIAVHAALEAPRLDIEGGQRKSVALAETLGREIEVCAGQR